MHGPADLEELQLILARMEMLRVTSLALKELLCTVALYKTYWDYRWADVKKIYDDKGETASTGEKASRLPASPSSPSVTPGSSSRRSASRASQSSKMSSAKEYFVDSPSSSTRGPDMALMVDDMLEQLDRKRRTRASAAGSNCRGDDAERDDAGAGGELQDSVGCVPREHRVEGGVEGDEAVETSQTLTMNQVPKPRRLQPPPTSTSTPPPPPPPSTKETVARGGLPPAEEFDDKLKCSFDPFDFTLYSWRA